MLRLYDVAKFKKDNTELGVLASYLVAVVDVLNNGEAYTVEFVNEEGDIVDAALFEVFLRTN